MIKECTFDELPEKLKKRIASVSLLGKKDNAEILRCRIDEGYDAECMVMQGSLIGLCGYGYANDKVTCTWLSKYDIEFLYNVIT